MSGVFTEREIKKIVEVCLCKGDEGLKTWEDILYFLNESLGRDYKDSKTYRNVFNNHITKTEAYDVKREIQKDKIKLQDVAREYRSDIRNQARLENLIEKMEESILTLKPFEIETLDIKEEGTDAVVLASDWHYGAKHDNYWGKYNSKIAKQRVEKYANEIIRYCKLMNVKELLMINMGDMIEGFIHVSTRIQMEMDAISQTIEVSELLASFIVKIRNELKIPIKVGDVLDNHSRIHPNKKDHIETETLQRIVREFLALRLKGTDIEFVRNRIDDNIGYYKLNGKNLVWVHGHLDNPNTVIERLSKGLDFKIHDLFIAHRHSILIKENVLQTGSLKGTDEYAKDKRLFGYASQVFRVYDNDNKITFEIRF